MQRVISRLISAAVASCLISAARGQEPSSLSGSVAVAPEPAERPTLYLVGYSHLDTQWRWCYPKTIQEMLPKTMRDNFRLFEQYPDYILNFSGANRYQMMKDYFPDDYEKVRKYVAAGRWFPCGSSMEEGDVNVPSAESIIRQVLYGNQYFRREFNQASNEFMLPDCFGFPASLPTILSHCGMKGFSTQKLTWGCAVGIPFNIGVWEGLDGSGLVCALNPGSYADGITEDLSSNQEWLQRIKENGKQSGIFADYRYFGLPGDQGGAPSEDSVKWLETSVKGSGPLRVVPSTAERMFLEIPPEKVGRLPRYQGDLLLTEHSAGCLTSAAYMKHWNHKNELLADAAERASVLADWINGPAYPRGRLNNAWALVLAAQFHDILPGTSHPKAYELSWNDELLALNQFAGVLDGAVSTVAAALDTRAQGVAVVIYNPLSLARQDVVEARLAWSGATPKGVRVVGPDRKEVPSQIISTGKGALNLLFLASVPSVGFAVYDVQPAEVETGSTELKVDESSLENARYRVSLDTNGDVSGIFDKQAGREMLSAPSRLAFQYENPGWAPAWNMDWKDRQNPPRAYVEGPAKVRIAERGPVRVALEVVRESQGSRFVQRIRLAAGAAGDRIEFANEIDWATRESSLKAVFPLAVTNPLAAYNWEVGVIERGNNDPKKFEVPAHQWFDLTDAKGDYGVTVLAPCKYGSDKPDDRTLRLTLLYSPGTAPPSRDECHDQGWQDWGRHEIVYGLAGHGGDWRQGQTDWQAMRLDQPLIAFQSKSHDGKLGPTFSLLKLNNPRVRVMALKQAEQGEEIIVRLVELNGTPVKNIHIAMPAPITAAREVDGQERPIGEARVVDGELVTDLHGFGLRAFAVKPGAPPVGLPPPASQAVELPFDRIVTSRDGQKAAAGFDAEGRSIPAEKFPGEIVYRSVSFRLGPPAGDQPNAVICRGQAISLPTGKFNRLYLLAAANGERQAVFSIDDQETELTIQDWGGYIGQADLRVWQGDVPDFSWGWPYPFLGLRPAYVRPAPVAWFCSHRHTAEGTNAPYEYCYLFAYVLELPAGAKTLTLPKDDRIRIMAVTAAADSTVGTVPAQPLMDELRRDVPLSPKISPAEGKFTDLVPVILERPLFGGACDIRYTLDGSDPTANSPRFEAPFLLYQETVVKARLFEAGRPVGSTTEARLRINDVTPPKVLEAEMVGSLPTVNIRFSEPVDRSSAEDTGKYKIAGGVKVETATLAPEGRAVMLTLSAPPPNAKVVLTVNGVRDRSPAGNPVAGVTLDVICVQPLVEVKEQALDGTGGRIKELPLGADAPTAAGNSWTINVWLWIDAQPGDYALIAGFGDGKDETGTQRYLTKFPHGFHFWGSGVDITGNTPLDVGQWQMLTATFDGSVVKLFKDGRALTAEKASFADAAPVAKIGAAGPWSYTHKLAGKIRDFSLWGQALSPASVAGLHRLGQRPEAP